MGRGLTAVILAAIAGLVACASRPHASERAAPTAENLAGGTVDAAAASWFDSALAETNVRFFDGGGLSASDQGHINGHVVWDPSAGEWTEAQRVADINRARDPRNLQFWNGERRAPPYVGLTALRRGAFPGKRFVEVRGYAFGFRWNLEPRNWAHGDPTEDGFRCRLQHANEQFCPSNVGEGARLDARQTARLVRALDQLAHPKNPGIGLCGFEPHHGFVFYDEKGSIVGQLLVCFTCSKAVSYPRYIEPYDMSQELASELRDLCRELDLGGCSVGARWSDIHDDDDFLPYDDIVRSATQGIETASLKDLDDLHRRRVCSLFAISVSRGWASTLGPQSTLWEMDGCDPALKECPATVTEAASCARHYFRTTKRGTSQLPSECGKISACVDAWVRAITVQPTGP